VLRLRLALFSNWLVLIICVFVFAFRQAAICCLAAANRVCERDSNYQRRVPEPLNQRGCVKDGHAPFNSATMVMLRGVAPIKRM
jgi:hypothetical protein